MRVPDVYANTLMGLTFIIKPKLIHISSHKTATSVDFRSKFTVTHEHPFRRNTTIRHMGGGDRELILIKNGENEISDQ